MYKLTNTNNVIRLADNATIPNDPANYDYINYLEWLSSGNTPTPLPTKTLEQIRTEYENAIQAHLDDTAKAKGYDDILSACSYASAPNPFQDESVKIVGWRGSIWEYCYNELAKVDSGARSMPTIDAFIQELPAL